MMRLIKNINACAMGHTPGLLPAMALVCVGVGMLVRNASGYCW